MPGPAPSPAFDAEAFWRRAKAWMRDSVAGSEEPFALAPAATDAELDSLEELLGFKLPLDLRALYRVHGGQTEEDAFSLLPCGVLLTVAEMRREWEHRYRDCHVPDAYDALYLGDRARRMVAHPGWVPLSRTPDGVGMELDFVPGPKGTPGQVLYPVDECNFVIVGTSLGEFLDRFMTMLEQGEVEVEGDGDEDWYLHADDSALKIHKETPYDA